MFSEVDKESADQQLTEESKDKEDFKPVTTEDQLTGDQSETEVKPQSDEDRMKSEKMPPA